MNAFIRKTSWGVADYLASVMSIILLFWAVSPLYYPASDWIVLNKVTAFDAKAGDEIILKINRELLQGTFYGRYEVEVRTYPDNIHICTARRSVSYVDTAKLEIDVERPLDWWAYSTDGECVRWVPTAGQYYITTRHCWHGAWWARESCNPMNKSNVFTVYD